MGDTPEPWGGRVHGVLAVTWPRRCGRGQPYEVRVMIAIRRRGQGQAIQSAGASSPSLAACLGQPHIRQTGTQANPTNKDHGMTAQEGSHVTPPYQLEGLVLPNGWKVGRRAAKKPDESGGYFSVGYECTTDNGRQAFLKAIDLHKELAKSDNVLRDLAKLGQEVQGERELLEQCKSMDRVVTILDAGDIRHLNDQKLDIPVPYIIFEKADATARGRVFSPTPPKHAWRIRILHHIAVGLKQLHGKSIAHQDVKLSNVLIFEKQGGAKISDLGRSVLQGRSIPHENVPWPGDLDYAPPEAKYGYIPPEFNARRFSADLFLLGSATCCLITGAQINAFLYDELPRNMLPPRYGGEFTGTYADVLPHLKDAFERSMIRIQSKIPPNTPFSERLPKMIREWCDPDPSQRGHPITKAQAAGSGNQYSLERYVAELDLLAHKAELHEQRQAK